MDVVTHNFANENTRVYFDEKHQWYYWHGLQVDEVIAFVQADSAAENRAGMIDGLFTTILSRGFVCLLTLTTMQVFPIRLFEIRGEVIIGS